MFVARIRTPVAWLLIQALVAQLAVQSVAFVHGFAHSTSSGAIEIHHAGHDAHEHAHAHADVFSYAEDFRHDCRDAWFDHDGCGNDLIHFLAHLAHCCQLVGISTSPIEDDIVRVEATRFRAQVARRASIVRPALFRPPISS